MTSLTSCAVKMNTVLLRFKISHSHRTLLLGKPFYLPHLPLRAGLCLCLKFRAYPGGNRHVLGELLCGCGETRLVAGRRVGLAAVEAPRTRRASLRARTPRDSPSVIIAMITGEEALLFSRRSTPPCSRRNQLRLARGEARPVSSLPA